MEEEVGEGSGVGILFRIIMYTVESLTLFFNACFTKKKTTYIFKASTFLLLFAYYLCARLLWEN